MASSIRLPLLIFVFHSVHKVFPITVDIYLEDHEGLKTQRLHAAFRLLPGILASQLPGIVRYQ